MVRVESLQANFQKSLLPTCDGGRRRLEAFLDDRERESIGQHQNEFGAEYEARWQGSRLSDILQFPAVLLRETNWFGARHKQKTHPCSKGYSATVDPEGAPL